jgi:hypothetical protein
MVTYRIFHRTLVARQQQVVSEEDILTKFVAVQAAPAKGAAAMRRRSMLPVDP